MEHVPPQGEAVLREGGQQHALPARQQGSGAVGDVAGVRDQHLVARVHQHPQSQVDGLRRADGDEDLRLGVVFEAEPNVEIVRDGLPELRRARVGSVSGLPRPKGRHGRVPDMPGGDEIRLTDAQ